MVKKKRTKTIFAWILMILGLLVVFGTHIAILAMGIPQDSLGGHAMLNIGAGISILIGFFIGRIK